MEHFRAGQRIRVINRDGMQPQSAQLTGKIGTVVCPRISDSGAWVRMDEDLPRGLHSFPAGDSRRNHVLLYPQECEVLVESGEKSAASASKQKG